MSILHMVLSCLAETVGYVGLRYVRIMAGTSRVRAFAKDFNVFVLAVDEYRYVLALALLPDLPFLPCSS